MRTTLYGVLGFTMTWIGLVAADKAPLTGSQKEVKASEIGELQ